VMLTGQWSCADITRYSTSAADWCWLASEHVLTSLATAHLQPPTFIPAFYCSKFYHYYWHWCV